MKIKNPIFFIFLLLSLVFFFSCKKNNITYTSTEKNQSPTKVENSHNDDAYIDNKILSQNDIVYTQAAYYRSKIDNTINLIFSDENYDLNKSMWQQPKQNYNVVLFGTELKNLETSTYSSYLECVFIKNGKYEFETKVKHPISIIFENGNINISFKANVYIGLELSNKTINFQYNGILVKTNIDNPFNYENEIKYPD